MASRIRDQRVTRRAIAATVAGLVLFSSPAAGQSDSALIDPSVQARESRPLGRPKPSGPAGELVNSKPARSDGASPSWIDHPLVRTGGSLAVVLGLIFGLARLARKMNGRGSSLATAFGGGGAAAPSGIIEVLGRYPIGRGQTLLLLRIDTRVLLIAQTSAGLRLRGSGAAGGLTTLCEMSNPEDVASILLKVQDAEQASTAAKFSDLLGRFDARHAESSGGVVEVGAGRKMRSAPSGDRAELWDATALAPGSPPALASGGSLRSRLDSLRAGGRR